jgi:hypothetical protein
VIWGDIDVKHHLTQPDQEQLANPLELPPLTALSAGLITSLSKRPYVAHFMPLGFVGSLAFPDKCRWKIGGVWTARIRMHGTGPTSLSSQSLC